MNLCHFDTARRSPLPNLQDYAQQCSTDVGKVSERILGVLWPITTWPHARRLIITPGSKRALPSFEFQRPDHSSHPCPASRRGPVSISLISCWVFYIRLKDRFSPDTCRSLILEYPFVAELARGIIGPKCDIPQISVKVENAANAAKVAIPAIQAYR